MRAGGTIRGLTVAVLGAVSLVVASGAAAGSAPPPARIVSLNPCLDTILVHVADRGQIAALSHYAREPGGSTISGVARTLPFTYETAEEVIARKPDLVLTSQHSQPGTRAALARLGIRTALFKVPETLAESIDQVRDVAAAVGHPARGEALARRIEAAMAAARQQARGVPPIPTVVFQPGGFSPGKGSLPDALLALAGFDNVAARYGVAHWGVIPLERLVADPPRLVLAGGGTLGEPFQRTGLLAHPVLDRLAGRLTIAPYPAPLFYCGGPAILPALAYLQQARREVAGVAATSIKGSAR